MATYYTRKCPHCKNAYQIHTFEKHPHGSPFRSCSKCGGHFIDTDYIEVALLPPRKRKVWRFDFAPVFLILFGIALEVLAWLDYPTPINFVWLILVAIGIWLLYGELKEYPQRCAKMEEELRQSTLRLSNPHYVIALRNIGYHLPERLIEQASQAIEKEKSPQE